MKQVNIMFFLLCFVNIVNAQSVLYSFTDSKKPTMRILYIFPHPDDESFGPAPVMKQQLEQGNEVYLLTLTRGGATKVRHQLGLSVEQMGAVRYKEMLQVKEVLGLSGMTVLDLPDSKLQEMDPRDIEQVVATHVRKLKPQVIVTYPVHGVSGFHDHLVTHAVVKRVFVDLKSKGANYLKRLAFVTVPNRAEQVNVQGNFILKNSDVSLIDCEVSLNDKDIEVLKQSLACYETYKQTIEQSGITKMIGDRLYFEIYKEDHKPVLSDLTGGIGEPAHRDRGNVTAAHR
jgi:N-acetylglucosamine malate deacetylase 2